MEFKFRALDSNRPSPTFSTSQGHRQNPEKGQIVEDIISAEVALRLKVEREVRREIALMMEEKNNTMQVDGGGGGGSSSSTSGISFSEGLIRQLNPRISYPFYNPFGDPLPKEHVVFCANNGLFNQWPLMSGIMVPPLDVDNMEKQVPLPVSPDNKEKRIILSVSPDDKEKQVMLPVSQVNKEKQITLPILADNKEKKIILAKPDSKFYGAKRKAVDPPLVLATDHEISFAGKKKMPTEEWSCSLCQITATSERGLNEHLQGKKHRAKEAKLKAGTMSKKARTVGPSKETASSMKLNMVDAGSVLKEKAEREEPQDMIDGLVKLTGNKEEEEHKSNEMPAPKNQDAKILNDIELTRVERLNLVKFGKNKRQFKFWCEVCNIGTFDRVVMEGHLRGKKHSLRAKKITTEGRKKENKSAAEEAIEDIATTTKTNVVLDAGSEPNENVGVGKLSVETIETALSEGSKRAKELAADETKEYVVATTTSPDVILVAAAESSENVGGGKFSDDKKTAENGSNEISLQKSVVDGILKYISAATEQIEVLGPKFRCEMCRYGPVSKEAMEHHVRVNMHLSRLSEHIANGATNETIPWGSYTMKDQLALPQPKLEGDHSIQASEKAKESATTDKITQHVLAGKDEAKSNVVLAAVNDTGSKLKDKKEAKTCEFLTGGPVPTPNEQETDNKNEEMAAENLMDIGAAREVRVEKIPKFTKKRKYKFWCEMCQSGAFSEVVMENHKRGRKHMKRIRMEQTQNGTANQTFTVIP